MQYREHTVPRGRYRIYARDYPGEEPEIVLMHGFPDDLHLYDRLVPHLSSRWVVVFDFLGWGRSDKPEGCPYTADNQRRDLDAVIWHPGLEVACWLRELFEELEVVRWDAPLVELPTARAVRDYLIGKQVAPDQAQAVAEATELPLSVTKRGALLFARKGS